MPWFEPGALIGLFLISGLLSAVATGWAMAHARRRGLIDLPGERRSHASPTPRGGGVGIALAGLGTCTLLACVANSGWWWLGAGLLLVAAVGWWDDHRPLPAWPRLLAHVLAAGFMAAGMAVQGASWPVVLCAFALTPALINAWNFMDGIDGLVSSQSLLLAAAFACVLDGAALALALAIAAACAGFLPFNLPKARIFLGDIGSGALGYLSAAVLATGLAGASWQYWPLLLLPATVCLVDSGMTLVWRALRGEAWWQPHVQHLYQRLARSHGHGRVTAVYCLWTVAACGSMLALMHLDSASAWEGAALFIGLAILVWWRLHGQEDA